MKKVNVKEFVKNHKKAIAMGVAGIGLTAGGVIIFKRFKGASETKYLFKGFAKKTFTHSDLEELKQDVKLVDAFATVMYEDGSVGITGDIVGLVDKAVADGLIPAVEEIVKDA